MPMCMHMHMYMCMCMCMCMHMCMCMTLHVHVCTFILHTHGWYGRLAAHVNVHVHDMHMQPA